MKKVWKRLYAMALVLALCLSLLPTAAWAGYGSPGEELLTPEVPVTVDGDEQAPQEIIEEEQGELSAAAPSIQGYTQVTEMPSGGLDAGYYLIVVPVGNEYYVLFPGATGQSANNIRKLWKASGDVYTGLAERTGTAKAAELTAGDNLILKSEGDAALYSVTAQGPNNANYALFVGSNVIYSNSGTSETRIVKYDNGFGICNNHSAHNDGYSYLGYCSASNLLCFGQGWHAYANVVLREGDGNAYENFMLYKSNTRTYTAPLGAALRTNMFNTTAGDNTWAITGGRAAQGSFADIGNARTFAGHFEEYIRWTNGGGSDSNTAARMAMQRYVIDTAYADQTLANIVSDSGWGRITALDPKAALYMAGPEDVTATPVPEAFSTNLRSFITKSFALRNGSGYAAIMKPYKTADTAYNTKVDAYNAAIDAVVNALTAEQKDKVVVVDSVTLTAAQLNGQWPNDKGHLVLSKALTEAALGRTISSSYPNNQNDTRVINDGTWADKLTTDGPALPRSAPSTLSTAQQAIKTKVDNTSTPMTWLFMGDSITHGALWAEGQATLAQGFEKFVKDDLGRKTDVVINTGVSGATTDTTVATLAERLNRYSPDVVTIMLGTNDAKGLNETTYKNNLRTILNAVTGSGEGQKGAIAVLRTPIPNNRSESGQDAGGAHVHRCAQYAREVAQEHVYEGKVILVDQFAEWSPYLMLSDSNVDGANGSTFLYSQVFTVDRLHPGPRGHLWMTQELIEGMGLWDATKNTCKLRYPLDANKITTETNTAADLSGLFQASKNGANASLTVRPGQLKAVSGLNVQHVVYAEVSATVNGTQVTKTAFRDDGVATLEGLSATGTYSVTIKALVQTSTTAGKLMTFVRNVDMSTVTPELTIQGYTQVKTLPENGLEEGYYLIVAPVNGNYYVLYPGATGTGAGVVNTKTLTVNATTKVGTALAGGLTLDKADNLLYKDELNGNYHYTVTAKHDNTTTYNLLLQSSPVYQTSGTSNLTITQPDATRMTFRVRGASTMCFNTATDHNNFNQMSEETAYSTIFYDMLLFRKDGVNAPSRGFGSALRMGMFPPNSMVNDDGFNSWVFTGGRAAQGLIADIGNARNYMGLFEEYNRGNGPGGTANGHEIVYQRHTINVAARGQTLAQVVSDDGWSRVTALDPRAVAHLVSVEDMPNTDAATIAAFKTSLNSFITKSLALRDNKGFAVIQKPYKTTDTAYNTKVDAFNTAIDEVTTALSNDVQGRISVVPSVTLAAGDLSADGYPNDKGHWRLGYQFTQTVMGVTFANANQFPSRFAYEYNGVMNQVWVNRASTTPTSYVQGSVTADADLTTAQRAIKEKMAAGDVTWLFMGDSITHGLGYAQGQATLAQAFEKFVRDDLNRPGDTVINTAVSGAGTKTTLAGTCIDARLKKYDADVVSIMLGTNDAADAAYVTVTADEYRANLRTLIHLIIDPVSEGGKDAIAVLRTPIATVDNSSNRNANITTFAGIMKEVYAEFEDTGKVILIDQHTEWANYLKTAYSGTGANFLYDEVYSQTISGNRLHPGPIGHLWMTHEFIDGLGLWDNDSYICKLHYSVGRVTVENSSEDISSSITPNAGKTSLSLPLAQLNRFAGSGQTVPVIRAELTATADGQTVTAEAFGIDGSGKVTLTGLDPTKTYSVKVKALVQTNATSGKSITFGPYEINMAEARVEMSKEVSHKTTDSNETNYFVFSGNNTWTAGDNQHVWSNALGADPTDTWYEVHFTGHKIDVYAGKNSPMGKVKYYIDDQEMGEYDLYHAGNVQSTFIASFGGLTEGEHIFKAVATGTKNASATGTQIDCAKVIVYSYMDLESGLFGGVVSDNLQYVQADYQTVIQQGATAKTLNAWKNDTAVSQIALASGGQELTNVTVTVSNFTGPNGASIPSSAATATFVKSVQAYTGMPGYGNPDRDVPPGNRAEASEVLYQTSPLASMDAGTVQPVWLSINVPKTAAAGTYTGTVTVSATGLTEPMTLTYTLKVADATLPDADTFKDTFDIELWQNPFASAEYYGVTPFSQEHFTILRPIMEKYKAIGGHAITTTIVDEAWAGQTYSANDVHIPSMVEWTKNSNGTWSFDYTKFDAWVTFNKNLGIGDKIVCYSVAPWSNAIPYRNADGTTGTITRSSNTDWNATWTAAWRAMLTDLMRHVEEKGWKDQIYIGIDERGFAAAAFDLIDSIVGTDGEPFKTAGAMDGFVNKRDLAMRVDDLNVGSIAVKAHPTEFEALRADREEAGLRTTVYSCTGHAPGNFSLSAPGESYWTMMYSYSVGGQGFLRWAYDSWVADPLRDTTHNAFEAGDCFLIFPDEKANKANARALSSLRLEKMAEGVRDVNKLMKIKADCPAMDTKVDALLANAHPTYATSGYYLSDAGKTALAADMDTIKAGIVTLTTEYLERMESGDTKKLNIRPKNVPLVTLPDEYQSDVEGPHADQVAGASGRKYLGQPDMIQTPEGTLVTVFPQGHGHGPLVMKKSEDKGETWEEIETPSSWARSLETPTMYRLNMTDGTYRYVMITARPNWDTNAGTGKGGWDASISDDGIHWSESRRYQEDIGYTIVAMASLVQLKDANGQWMDKWMGVFHDYNFVNYKTYLTFDANGNMQWSEPVRYLSQYRDMETQYHICEVGMFRSPDGNRIMALSRSDHHDNVHASLMFWSDDEGETWSKPVEMQGALAGERHKALYDPISGRLVITFREIIWDTNNNGVYEGSSDWLAGDWIAWVGTYDDLMERNEGQYRILLDEDWANNAKSGDTGYTGMSVFEDGTFVLDTYGHWDKDYSQGQGSSYNVRTDLCWIRQAKFTLEQIDGLYDQQREEQAANQLTELDSTVLAAKATANSQQNPAAGNDGPAAYAFDDQARWWHSRYSGTAGAGETAENGHPSADNPIWIQTGFGEARYIKEITYQARSNGACAINDYELQLACLDDPSGTPTDDDFTTVKEGNLSSTAAAQTITLDNAYRATHVRLVATSVHGTNNYVTAQRIRIFAAGTGVAIGGTAAPLAKPTTPGSITASSVSDTTATLTWTASTSANGNITQYRLFLDDARTPTRTVTDASQHTGTLTRLTPNTTYTAKVVAADDKGQVSEAGTVTFTTTGGTVTPPDPPTPTAPTAPGNVTVTNITDTSATVSWTASTASGGTIRQYRIFLGDAAFPSATTASLTANLTGLTAGTSYTVRVVAVDSAGRTSQPGTATFATTGGAVDPPDPPTPTAPTAPGNVAVSDVTTTSATVTWTASASEGGTIVQYKVFLGDAAIPMATVTGLTAHLTGLTAETAYTVRVVAVDSEGQTSQPGTATFTTKSSGTVTPPDPGPGPGPAPGPAPGPSGGGAAGTPSVSPLPVTVETNEDGSKTTISTDPVTGKVTETTREVDGSTLVKVVSPQEGLTILAVDATGEIAVNMQIPAEIPAAGTTWFVDVPQNHWAAQAVNKIAALGVVNGVGGQKYDPVSSMTRGGVATVLCRLANGSTSSGQLFHDVDANSYYADAVAWAAKRQVVQGVGEDNFLPDQAVTRQEFAVMLRRYARLIGMNESASVAALNTFVDRSSIGTWAAEDMAWCVSTGILQGKLGGVLDPTAQVSRAEVAVMLNRFITLVQK